VFVSGRPLQSSLMFVGKTSDNVIKLFVCSLRMFVIS
jgi:hypothetical protein